MSEFDYLSVIRGWIQPDADPLFRVVFLLLALLGFASAHERLHQLLAVVVLVGSSIYIGLLFVKLA